MKVVYDMDGVLNNINRVLCEDLGIDESRLYTYDSFANQTLSIEQREYIWAGYHRVDTFERAGINKEALELKRLSEHCDLVVQSLSFSYNIADFKHCLLRDVVGLKESQILLPVGPHKEQLPGIDVYVEDCLKNALESTAKVKLLIDKPYNQTDDNTVITRVANLEEANKYVEYISKL